MIAAIGFIFIIFLVIFVIALVAMIGEAALEDHRRKHKWRKWR